MGRNTLSNKKQLLTYKKRRSLKTCYSTETNDQTNDLTRTFSSCSMNDENASLTIQNTSQLQNNSSLILDSGKTPMVTTGDKFFNPTLNPFDHPGLEKKYVIFYSLSFP